MSALSKNVPPAASAASSTAAVSSAPIRRPKLLHPSPTTDTSSAESPSRRVGRSVGIPPIASRPVPETYAIPQEFLDFRETIRQIATERIAPRAGEIDRTGEYPWDVRQLLAEQDILGLPFAEEFGGTGTGTLMLQIAVEEI